MTSATDSIALRADSSDIKQGVKDLRDLDRQAAVSERSAARMGRSFKQAFAALGAGIILRQVIKNTAEQEKVTAQLNQTLRSTGRYSAETSKALLDHAAALQQVTTYGDEAVISAQSQLLTFTNLGSKVFPRATEAALDLSEKMGQDLKSSVVQLGKALNDPIKGITALERVGVSFTKSQRETIKNLAETNRLAEAQGLILDELEKEFGGSAKAARDTFGGALKAVQNALGDLLEADGDSLTGATAAMNELADILNSPEVKAGFANLTSAIITATGWFAKLSAAAVNAGTAIGEEFAIALNGGKVAMDDFQRRAEQIVEIERQIAAAQESINQPGVGQNSPFVRAVKEDIAALQEKLRVQRESLTLDLQDAGFASQRRGAPDTGIPGLDGEPLAEVTVDAKAKDIEAAMRAVQRAMREAAEEAAGNLSSALNDLTAQMGGPTAEAGTRLAETYQMLAEQERVLAQTGQLTLDREQQLASARALALQQYEETIAAIEEEARLKALELTQAEQVIAQLEFENELMGLNELARRQRIAVQYAGIEATEAEIAKIEELVAKQYELENSAIAWDNIRGSASGALASLLDGTQSASDALDDFLKRMRRIAAQIVAEKIIETIFGSFGSSDGGLFGDSGSGGGFGAFIGALFGPGRAHGGTVLPGRLHPVGENGPELLRSGSKQYLIPGQTSGTVQPITNHNATNNTRVQIFVSPEERRQTINQIASQSARRISRAQNRNA